LKNVTKTLDGLREDYIDQFIVDYFGINVIVFSVENDNIVYDDSYILNTNLFENKFNKMVPVLFICREEDKYHSILKNDNKSIVKYSENKQLINNLYIKFNININRREYEAMTLTLLREMVEKKGINIMKESGQTGKMIYRKKNELIDELGKLDFL